MLLTNEQCIKLHSAICAGFINKDDLNNLFNDETLKLKIDFSNYPIKNDLNKLQCQYKHGSQNHEIKILIFEAPHADLLLSQEYDSIISSIKESSDGNSFLIFRERVISADEISKHIAEMKPDIVHFAGHGLEDGSFSLGKEIVKPEFLESRFKSYTGQVKCVIFNTCHSEKIAEIISPYIDYVISMKNSIIDEKAIHFSKSFYSGLVQAYSDGIDIFLNGFVEGIIALKNDNYNQDLIPVLNISYEQAILNYIKGINVEIKIGDFIEKIKSNLSANITNKLFHDFYLDYSYPIKEEHLNQLLVIINEIENQNLVKSAYRDTLPKNATIDNNELNKSENLDNINIISILRRDYPKTDNNQIPSILEFAKNLATKLKENTRQYQDLEKWVGDVSSKLNISVTVQPKYDLKPDASPKTFLFIKILPEDNKLSIEAEFILDENQKSQLQPFDFQETSNDEANNGKGMICNSFEEIYPILEKIINNFLAVYREEISKPIIEIFLPHRYLGKNLDKDWLIQEENSTALIPVIQQYNIILHPIERFISNLSYINFRQGWSRLIKVLESKSNISSVVGDIEIIKKIDSKTYHKIGSDFQKKNKIGVKLTSPLPKEEQQEQDFFWRAVLKGGIPLAFWTRYHTREDINLDDIDCHLTVECLSNNFQNLIDKMYDIRREAYDDTDNSEECLGYHLGFLCDNLNRKPNIKPLQKI